VVLVQRPGSSQRHSGFLLDRQRRLVITTADAVGRKDTAVLTFPAFRAGVVIAGARYYQERKLSRPGVVLARDPVRNLALVEAPSLPAGVEEVHLASEPPEPGDSLHALGNSDRMATLFLYSAGWLRQRGRAQLGPGSEDPEVPVLLVQLMPTEGEAGGPLLNDRAELVGVLAGKSAPQQQIGYALPLSELQAFLNDNRGRWEPARAGDWIERGLLFLKARQAERAIGDLSQAIRIDPEDARACSERSRAYQQQGDLERALEDSNRAIRLQPKLSPAYSQRAAVQVQRGRAREAVADCETALQLDRGNATAYRVRGEAHRLLGELERALADCSEAIWLDRKSAPAYLQRGRVHAAREERDRALADYNQALALDPELAEAYRCRGDLFWARSDVAAAWTDYDQAVTLAPSDALAWLGRGRAWSARKDSARALSDFRQGLDRQPGLAREVIAAVVGRARELQDGQREDLEFACRLYRGALELLGPLAGEKMEAARLIRAGLMQAQESDPAACVKRLREVLEAVRQRW
jgi:tetratricopeptide (TPR) repeat protein